MTQLTPPEAVLSEKANGALGVLAEAGELARCWYDASASAALGVQHKGDGTPVTKADIEIERFMRDRLATLFPHDGQLGEEFGETIGTSGSRWIMDPIDGTKSFIRQVPLYATLLAHQVDNEVDFGAISLPSLGIVLYAERGAGCWRNGIRQRVSDHEGMDGACVLATWLEDWSPEAIRDLHLQGATLRTWGDAFGYAMVASGVAEAIIDFNVHVYDLAPLPVIIEEAGGTFTDFSGARRIDAGTAIASNGKTHDAAMRLAIKEPPCATTSAV